MRYKIQFSILAPRTSPVHQAWRSNEISATTKLESLKILPDCMRYNISSMVYLYDQKKANPFMLKEPNLFLKLMNSIYSLWKVDFAKKVQICKYIYYMYMIACIAHTITILI